MDLAGWTTPIGDRGASSALAESLVASVERAVVGPLLKCRLAFFGQYPVRKVCAPRHSEPTRPSGIKKLSDKRCRG
ncbi:hypothetical protein ACVWXM_001529 [Bradyrhizobium sp. GM7.3]